MTRRRTALLVVDVQNGFISEPDELPVKDGAEVIPVINGMLRRDVRRVASQDWHPADHGSFASNHSGVKPFDVGTLGGVSQVFWPDHCVQGTRGAEFHPDLDQRRLEVIFRKGTDPGIDSYSAFRDNAGRNATGLEGYLRALEIEHLVIAGLALDYCVRYSALDARRLLPSLGVTVVQDACRPVDPETGVEALDVMREHDVRVVSASEIEW